MDYSFRFAANNLTCNIPRMIAHTTVFVEHWLEREIAQWVHQMEKFQHSIKCLNDYASIVIS